MAGVIIRRENLETDLHKGRMSCEGRYQGDTSTAKIPQRLPENHWKLGKRHGIEKNQSCRHLIKDL
jgi:hypothetical protein